LNHAVFDTEIIGTNKPVFLVCVEIIETGERYAFWHHRKGHLKALISLMNRADLTWVSFNGIKFDAPLIAAWVAGREALEIKQLATRMIEERLMPWDVYGMLSVNGLPIDHIDLIEVAPGVMISLKTYEGRMHMKHMQDLPFDHNKDLTPKECKLLEQYCFNDIDATRELFHTLSEQIALRESMSAEHDIDLRSKSDAQMSETILKRIVGVRKSGNMPSSVRYVAPLIVKTKNPILIDLIYRLEQEVFKINFKNGSPIEPAWMKESFDFCGGVYKFGLGGLHSQHDLEVCYEADDEWMISDIDAASYYPSILLNCGLVPKLSGDRGEAFLDAYADIYHRRLDAKEAGDKATANSLKIALNGLFGKLGNLHSVFYAPDLLLAITITGQLNLLDLISDLTKARGIQVVSANTDGIMVRYKASMRDRMLKIVKAHAKKTGFEYEETQYRKVAIANVNNYIAVKLDGKMKLKGLFAEAGVLQNKNPTAEVCAQAAAAYLVKGTLPEDYVNAEVDIRQFVTIRGVSKPGGVQHNKMRIVDDWVEVEPRVWEYDGKRVERKSRPPAVEEHYGGTPFGRVARWYMTTEKLPPIQRVDNGYLVAKTEGARLCMTLPDELPKDLDKAWYVAEAYKMLKNMGVKI
jgi:hypothetical protein